MVRSLFVGNRAWDLSLGLTPCGGDRLRVVFEASSGERRCADTGPDITERDLERVPLPTVLSWFYQSVACAPAPGSDQVRTWKIGHPDRARRPYRLDGVAGLAEIMGPAGDPYEMGDTIAAALADPRYRADFGFLRDRGGEAPPTADYITRLMTLINAEPALVGTRWAIVAPDDASHAMARMAAALAHGAHVEVFRNRAAAVQWLARTRPISSR